MTYFGVIRITLGYSVFSISSRRVSVAAITATIVIVHIPTT
jgi:hypothetical protein